MLKNNGELPNEEIVFNCTKTGCILDKTNLTNYKLDGLEELDFKGTKPTSGKVTINNVGQKISVSNVKINSYNCYYPDSKGKANCNNIEPIENKKYNSGEAIELAGYKWHVISDYNGYLTLLMDAGQIEDMAHCGMSNDSSNNCTYNGEYYVYSWDKSLIRNYLNNELKNTLEEKISNEIVPVSICIDSSRNDGIATYGGYLKEEIENINGSSCNKGYETDYVRLISYSEYWNLSPYYSGINTNYPNTSEITKLSSDSDYANWLYCDSEKCGTNSNDWKKGIWWIMASCSGGNDYHVQNARHVNSAGSLIRSYGANAFGVRPVITIKK